MIFEISCMPRTTRNSRISEAGYGHLQETIDKGYNLFVLQRPQCFTYGQELTISEKIELRKAKKQGKQPKLIDQWKHGCRVITQWELS